MCGVSIPCSVLSEFLVISCLPYNACVLFEQQIVDIQAPSIVKHHEEHSSI